MMHESKGLITVLGAKESGVWAAVLARREGYEVFVSDANCIEQSYKALLQDHQIEYEEQGHLLTRLEESLLVIKSPGIPDSAPVIKRCQELGLPIVSEIEFAAQFLPKSRFIAVTGSNGKTTTVSLITHLLRQGGLDAIACGNIGLSLAQCAVRDQHQIYVVELSSFQLDHMRRFRADIALLTNITPDHLDRYGYSLKRYADAKGRIFDNLTSSDLAIYPLDDAVVREMLQRRPTIPDRAATFSHHSRSASAYLLDDDRHIQVLGKGGTLSIDTSTLPLQGLHNTYNMMAAVLVATEMGLSEQAIEQGLRSFTPVEHRMEYAGEVDGILFINDSKGTNLDSTQYALSAMPDGQTVLILGGTDKGNDYMQIKDLVRQKAKALIYLTTDSRKLHAAFDDLALETYDVGSIPELFQAVQTLDLAPGDRVLLSPACASFDLFDNYEHRGRSFKEGVRRFITSREACKK